MTRKLIVLVKQMIVLTKKHLVRLSKTKNRTNIEATKKSLRKIKNKTAGTSRDINQSY